MQMTENEIVKSYMEAKEKDKLICILAELNGCQRHDITAILRNNGVDLPGPKLKKIEEPKPKTYERITEYPEHDIEVPKCVKEELESSVQALNNQITIMRERRDEILAFLARL